MAFGHRPGHFGDNFSGVAGNGAALGRGWGDRLGAEDEQQHEDQKADHNNRDGGKLRRGQQSPDP